MKKLKQITLYIALFVAVLSNAYAQTFSIDDDGLAGALKSKFPQTYLYENTFSETEALKVYGNVDLTEKNIQSLKGIEYFKNLNSVDLRLNNLSFLDLLPLLEFENYTSIFRLYPQKTIALPDTYNFRYGNDAKIEIDDFENYNGTSFEWFLNGLLVKRTENPILEFQEIKLSQQGVYTCTIRHNSFPQLAIYTNPFTINIDEQPAYTCFDASLASIETKRKDCLNGNDIVVNYSSIKLGSANELEYMSLLSFNTNQLITRTSGHSFSGLKDSLYKLVIQDPNNCIDTVVIRNNYEPCDAPIKCFDDTRFEYLIENNCINGNSIHLFTNLITAGTSQYIQTALLNSDKKLFSTIQNTINGLKDSIYYIAIYDENKCTDTLLVVNEYDTCDVSCPEFNPESITLQTGHTTQSSILDLSPSQFYTTDDQSEYSILGNHTELSENSYTNFEDSTILVEIHISNLCTDTVSIHISPIKCPEFTSSDLPYTISKGNCYDGNEVLLDSSFLIDNKMEIKNLNKIQNTNYNLQFPQENLTFSLITSDNCVHPIVIDLENEPCKDNIIIASHQDMNRFYIDQEGDTQIYDTNGTLIKTLQTPEYWDGTDKYGNTVPMGDYYIISGDIFAITISVFH